MRIPLRELILYALLGVLLFMAQVALSLVPNIELVTLLIIAYTMVLGARALYPIYIFVLAEGLLYGFGLWFINYLYVWTLLAAVVLLLRRRIENRFLWAIVSGLYGLFFGALCAIPYFFMGGASTALAYWVSGIPFDLLHAAGNVITALLLLAPCCRVLRYCAAHAGILASAEESPK